MENRVVHERWSKVDADWLIVGYGQDSSFTGPLAELDEDLGGKVQKLKELDDFNGLGEFLDSGLGIEQHHVTGVHVRP